MEARKKVDELWVPREIMFQILKELPVKTLLRLRCVSKLWCSIIDDPIFVQKHHIRSHTRPEGLNLLLRHDERYHGSSILYSLDPEGGPVSNLRQLPLPEYLYIPFQSINGLVCINNCICNPSTREFKTLPPLRISVPWDVATKVTTPVDPSTKYFLGFDPSTNKYKVLAIARFFSNISIHAQLQFNIMTLGTNLWREIDTSGVQLNMPKLDMACAKTYCVNDVIYIISKIDSMDVIVAFEVGSEKFQIIRPPESASIETCSLVQVEQHPALIDCTMSAMWILEDYETQQWSRQSHSLILPRCDYFFKAVGTVHTAEILFLSPPTKLFYYNLESKALRKAGECSNLPYDGSSPLIRITKHVESLYRLKER